ncbi:hypothetical protein ACS386_00485 [Flavobacteriaceae bacterium LMO-SS05]
MKPVMLLFTMVLFGFYGCNTEDLTLPEAELSTANVVAGKGHGKVVHHVNLGSNDVCAIFGQQNGCDANFSLVANLYEDGYASGQWTDTFAGGGEGLYIAIDCAKFADGPGGIKYAIVSGLITKGSLFGEDVSGQRAVTFAADSGPGNQNDFVSFSIAPVNENLDCNALIDLDFLFNGWIIPSTSGEVVIW